MNARLLRLLHLTHRWLGTASGVLILAWFVSGLVMLYVPFPKLDTDERVSRQAALQPDALAVSPAQAAAACPGKLRGARLAMARGAPSTISAARTPPAARGPTPARRSS
jgi:hypothetical protein